MHNLPNLRWQTYRQPSGKVSEPRGPHLPGSLTSVTHRGSQGPPLCPRPDPRSESPSLGGLPELLPDGGAVSGHGGHAAQVRYPREPRPPKPRPAKAPPRPPPESWEVPAGGSPVFQGCVGRARGGAAPRGSLGMGRGCRRQGAVPASPASRDPLSFYRCVLPGGQGRTLRAPETWPFPGRGQGSTSLPFSRACVPDLLPSHLLRSAHADLPASLVLPGYSLVCLKPPLTHHPFQGASPDHLVLP